MIMQLTKNTTKPHIILYKRNDGTETWMHASDFFIRHDLSHYAIEKTLNYSTAFMGMLNNGMEITDFENREKRLQLTVSEEAWYAENMANLFLIEIAEGNFDDFNKISAAAFIKMNHNFPTPFINNEELNSVRKYLRELLNTWKELPDGEKITLNF